MTDLHDYFAQYTGFRLFAFIPKDLIYELESELDCGEYDLWTKLDQWWAEFQSLTTEEILTKINASNLDEDISTWENLHISTNLDVESRKGSILFELRPNAYNPDRNPWKLAHIHRGEIRKNAIIDNRPGSQLFAFSYWVDFDKQIANLATMALPENWALSNSSENRYYVLKKYVCYTFAKAYNDNLILYSEDKRYAVFNTGLVDKNYNYIYVVFDTTRSVESNRAPWIFNSFCIAGKGREGRLLSDNFCTLPPAVKYFNQISDISYVFNEKQSPADQTPDLQIDHYINNLYRFPLAFIKDIFRFNDSVKKMLEKVPDNDYFKSRTFWSNISDALFNDAKAYENFSAAINHAVKKAVLRASWNYRTVIPSYFPARNKMSILLPLSFVTDDHAEVALVVEKKKASDGYTAPTILSLAKAYSNSRLVCKIESDWLNPSLIKDTVDSKTLEDSEDIDEE